MNYKALTPLRYPGGKSKVVKKLLSPLFPNDFNDYYEPFIGGGSIALYIAQMYPDKNIYINDINSYLINLYKTLKNNSEEYINQLHIVRDNYPANDDNYREKLFNDMYNFLYKSNNDLEKSIGYYVINKISFSGLTENSSPTKHNYKKLFNHKNIDTLKVISYHMKNFIIHNEVFETFMLNPKDNDFTVLDPPYMIESSNLYGKKGEDHKSFNHEKFLNSVLNLKGKWLITYNDNEWIREKYKDFIIKDAEYRYCMAFSTEESGEKKTRMKNELIITNY